MNNLSNAFNGLRTYFSPEAREARAEKKQIIIDLETTLKRFQTDGLGKVELGLHDWELIRYSSHRASDLTKSHIETAGKLAKASCVMLIKYPKYFHYAEKVLLEKSDYSKSEKKEIKDFLVARNKKAKARAPKAKETREERIARSLLEAQQEREREEIKAKHRASQSMSARQPRALNLEDPSKTHSQSRSASTSNANHPISQVDASFKTQSTGSYSVLEDLNLRDSSPSPNTSSQYHLAADLDLAAPILLADSNAQSLELTVPEIGAISFESTKK